MTHLANIKFITGIEIMSDQINHDKRGYFNKIFSSDSSNNVVLNSLAISNTLLAGTLRGLHFQSGINAQEKVIKCIQGKIFDVVVDLRPNSRTFGHWSSLVLSAELPITLYLPIGIAHGYQSLEDNSQMLYGLTRKYDPENAYTIKFDDVSLNISWPLPQINISINDLSGITFDEAVKQLR